MIGKFYKVLTKICGGIGWIGEKVKFWAEFKEWEYWNDKQCKIIDLPEDVKVFFYYNRKGDYLELDVNYWPMKDGHYDNHRKSVVYLDLTKEKIQKLAVPIIRTKPTKCAEEIEK